MVPPCNLGIRKKRKMKKLFDFQPWAEEPSSDDLKILDVNLAVDLGNDTLKMYVSTFHPGDKTPSAYYPVIANSGGHTFRDNKSTMFVVIKLKDCVLVEECDPPLPDDLRLVKRESVELDFDFKTGLKDFDSSKAQRLRCPKSQIYIPCTKNGKSMFESQTITQVLDTGDKKFFLIGTSDKVVSHSTVTDLTYEKSVRLMIKHIAGVTGRSLENTTLRVKMAASVPLGVTSQLLNDSEHVTAFLNGKNLFEALPMKNIKVQFKYFSEADPYWLWAWKAALSYKQRFIGIINDKGSFTSQTSLTVVDSMKKRASFLDVQSKYKGGLWLDERIIEHVCQALEIDPAHWFYSMTKMAGSNLYEIDARKKQVRAGDYHGTPESNEFTIRLSDTEIKKVSFSLVKEAIDIHYPTFIMENDERDKIQMCLEENGFTASEEKENSTKAALFFGGGSILGEVLGGKESPNYGPRVFVNRLGVSIPHTSPDIDNPMNFIAIETIKAMNQEINPLPMASSSPQKQFRVFTNLIVGVKVEESKKRILGMMKYEIGVSTTFTVDTIVINNELSKLPLFSYTEPFDKYNTAMRDVYEECHKDILPMDKLLDVQTGVMSERKAKREYPYSFEAVPFKHNQAIKHLQPDAEGLYMQPVAILSFYHPKGSTPSTRKTITVTPVDTFTFIVSVAGFTRSCYMDKEVVARPQDRYIRILVPTNRQSEGLKYYHRNAFWTKVNEPNKECIAIEKMFMAEHDFVPYGVNDWKDDDRLPVVDDDEDWEDSDVESEKKLPKDEDGGPDAKQKDQDFVLGGEKSPASDIEDESEEEVVEVSPPKPKRPPQVTGRKRKREVISSEESESEDESEEVPPKKKRKKRKKAKKKRKKKKRKKKRKKKKRKKKKTPKPAPPPNPNPPVLPSPPSLTQDPTEKFPELAGMVMTESPIPPLMESMEIPQVSASQDIEMPQLRPSPVPRDNDRFGDDGDGDYADINSVFDPFNPNYPTRNPPPPIPDLPPQHRTENSRVVVKKKKKPLPIMEKSTQQEEENVQDFFLRKSIENSNKTASGGNERIPKKRKKRKREETAEDKKGHPKRKKAKIRPEVKKAKPLSKNEENILNDVNL
jgi:hypothetical protein